MCVYIYIYIYTNVVWNSQVHRELPGKFESSNLSRGNLCREIGNDNDNDNNNNTNTIINSNNNETTYYF